MYNLAKLCGFDDFFNRIPIASSEDGIYLILDDNNTLWGPMDKEFLDAYYIWFRKVYR